MKKKPGFIGKFILSLLVLCFGIYIIFTSFVYLSCFISSRKVNSNYQQELIRIKIYGSSTSSEGNTVSGVFSIVDSNGNEIAVIERSWKGSYLAIEFAQVHFNNQNFVFPDRIYGKNRINEEKNERKYGTELQKYYNENGQCILLGYGSKLSQRKALFCLSSFATKQYNVVDFGRISNYTIDLSGCETEKYYSIKKDEYGRITIQKL